MSSNNDRISELLILKEIAETLNQSYDLEPMLQNVLKKIIQLTGLTTAWIFMLESEQKYTFAADYQLPPGLKWNNKAPMKEGSCWCLREYWSGKLTQGVNIIECHRIIEAQKYKWGDTSGIVHHATIPIKAGQEIFGLLNIGAPGKNSFLPEELALLESVALQIGSAIKRTRLYDQQREIDQMAERNRLARDLHDSVCQMLFSLSLTAKGAESMWRNSHHSLNVGEVLQEIQELSQAALKEMRALIWEPRPQGLEQGFIKALNQYAKQFDIELVTEIKEELQISSHMEESLYRIGQELINNVHKHAQVKKAFFTIEKLASRLIMKMRDQGVGFDLNKVNNNRLGLLSIKVRVGQLNGTVDIRSKPNEGTTVFISIPIE